MMRPALSCILTLLVCAMMLPGCASSTGNDPNWEYTTVMIRIEPYRAVSIDPVHRLEDEGWIVYKVTSNLPTATGNLTYLHGDPYHENYFYYYLLRRPRKHQP